MTTFSLNCIVHRSPDLSGRRWTSVRVEVGVDVHLRLRYGGGSTTNAKATVDKVPPTLTLRWTKGLVAEWLG